MCLFLYNTIESKPKRTPSQERRDKRETALANFYQQGDDACAGLTLTCCSLAILIGCGITVLENYRETNTVPPRTRHPKDFNKMA